MEKFLVTIQTGTYSDINMQMEPSPDVLEVAKALSTQYKDKPVHVTMFSRVRWALLNGEITNEWSDLTHFYDNVTSQEEWDWSCLGAFPKQ